LSDIQDHLIRTSAGWVNLTHNTPQDWFFHACSIGYTLAGMCLLLRWRRRTDEPRSKKTATLLLGSMIAALMIHTLTVSPSASDRFVMSKLRR
jgi:uncharacterized membrane protein